MSQTGRESKRDVRERLAQERAEQAAAQQRKERMIRVGLVALVFLIVAGVGLGVYLSNRPKTDTAAAVPKGVTPPGGGVVVGTGTKPVMDVWEDFQCPACKAMEDALGSYIEGLGTSGKVKLIYHPLSFLDQNLNNDSSLRAANASGCAQDQGRFRPFHDQVYKNQPAKEGTGYTDAQLIQFGKDAGVADMTTFTQCVENHTYYGWVNNVQLSGNTAQVTSTPTFMVDGKKLDFSTAKSYDEVKTIIDQAIAAAS